MDERILCAAPIHIVGAGGLGREVLDAVLALGVKPADLVFVDEHPSVFEVNGVAVRRPTEVTGGAYVVAVADSAARRKLSATMHRLSSTPVTVVHPRATIATDAVILPGCVVLANAFVSAGVRLEPHTQVQYNATVGHDVVAHEYATVLPGANIAGGVALERDVTVGSNAAVLQNLRVGAGSFIGAGAVVTKSHPGGRVLTGVPARSVDA